MSPIVDKRAAQVLLVEDCPAQVRLVEIAARDLKSLELLHIAVDGDAALAYLRKEDDFENAQRPDVILLDLNMPKMNGFEVLEEVKNDENLRAIPVIVFTTSAHESDIAKAYENGASRFVTKPSDFDELQCTLEDLGRYWSDVKLTTAQLGGTTSRAGSLDQVSPCHRHIGLYHRLQRGNIHEPEAAEFLRMLHDHLQGKLIRVIDRYSVHRSAIRILREAKTKWFRVEWLPPYAPDLDPVEAVWNHTKCVDLANFIPYDLDELQDAVIDSLEQQAANPLLKRASRV